MSLSLSVVLSNIHLLKYNNLKTFISKEKIKIKHFFENPINNSLKTNFEVLSLNFFLKMKLQFFTHVKKIEKVNLSTMYSNICKIQNIETIT